MVGPHHTVRAVRYGAGPMQRKKPVPSREMIRAAGAETGADSGVNVREKPDASAQQKMNLCNEPRGSLQSNPNPFQLLITNRSFQSTA